ncbi:MAG: LPS assembly lipoprotein LptE [Methylovulum sp.]|nr:LPS assembly lipoprotein LptE [Methylovulum sp.]
MKKLVVVIIAVWLSACGYHLRGAMDMPEALKSVYLEGASIPLREQFKRAMRPASGKLASSPENAGIVIRVFGENSGQRVLSLNERGRSNELELYYRFDYELATADNTPLITRQPIEIKREYFNNQQDILAKGNEEIVIRNEMYQQAVRAIVDRSRVVLDARAK